MPFTTFTTPCDAIGHRYLSISIPQLLTYVCMLILLAHCPYCPYVSFVFVCSFSCMSRACSQPYPVGTLSIHVLCFLMFFFMHVRDTESATRAGATRTLHAPSAPLTCMITTVPSCLSTFSLYLMHVHDSVTDTESAMRAGATRTLQGPSAPLTCATTTVPSSSPPSAATATCANGFPDAQLTMTASTLASLPVARPVVIVVVLPVVLVVVPPPLTCASS